MLLPPDYDYDDHCDQFDDFDDHGDYNECDEYDVCLKQPSTCNLFSRHLLWLLPY